MKTHFIVILGLFLVPLIGHPQDTTVSIEITNLGHVINSTFDDYAPVISADESMLLFTSRRPASEKEKKNNKAGYENIYVAVKKSGKWRTPTILPPPVNNTSMHNSNIALSPDGQRMLVFMNDAGGKGDIYESILNGKTWSEPMNLGKPINSEAHETSASISYDGKTIYFVSDRPGGKGGRDIYSCTKQENGSWGKAINLGKTINTAKDEEGVFIHPDGKTLYFSSQGHESIGGYDIFKTIYDKKTKKWSQPVNIGKPINTEGDDLFLVLSASGEHGYYASQNKEDKNIDIFLVTFTYSTKESQSQVTVLKGIVTDEKTLAPIESNVEITDNSNGKSIATFNSNSETGNYLVTLPSGGNYGISVSADGYLFHSENITIPESAGYQEITKDVALKKLEKGVKIILNNIFFDVDEATLRNESESELQRMVKILKDNPNIRVEIGGHTDNSGSDAYNLDLSSRRAKSVVDYLVAHGIAISRLESKGYGESTPIATNDTEEGKQLNRRTEFRIL